MADIPICGREWERGESMPEAGSEDCISLFGSMKPNPPIVVDYEAKGLSITIPNLRKGARRISVCVARFGETYKRYDCKSNQLVTHGGTSIPCHDQPEYTLNLELPASTRYSVKYCVLYGDIWTPVSEAVQECTQNSQRPLPPKLEILPGKLGIRLPKLPPNAQHLTLWFKKGDGTYKVFDYLTKTVIHNEGRAIPIWDCERYFEVKLDPDQVYSVKYSLMQNDTWNVSSIPVSARTLPETKWYSGCV